MTDKFHWVLNAAARVVTNSGKYDRGLSYARMHELCWLDVSECIQFHIAVTVRRRPNELTPVYLSELCVPASPRHSKYRLQSSFGNELAVLAVKLSTYWYSVLFGVWAMCLEQLSDYLRNWAISIDSFMPPPNVVWPEA